MSLRVLARTATLAVALVAFGATEARADAPIALLERWEGPLEFFATGAALASDGPDEDENVDAFISPATVEISPADVPPTAAVQAAYLYWGGSVNNSDCGGATIDDAVEFVPAGGSPVTVLADACYCSKAGAGSYDLALCRADVLSLITVPTGTFSVDKFSARVENEATNNASFSIVMVYREEDLNPRRVALYDGLQTMSSTVNPTQKIQLLGLDVDDPAQGDLTWYVLEGDVNGSTGEGVSVTGQPGGNLLQLTDGLNPIDNPMNHTINTTTPVQTDTIGVDIDTLDICFHPERRAGSGGPRRRTSDRR